MASLTWRAPHSPRSCRTASISVKMPNIPGCVYDKRRPWCSSGSPARRGALAGDEGPAFAVLAEAQASRVSIDGDGEGVVDLGDVDVVVRDAGALEGEAPRDDGGVLRL